MQQRRKACKAIGKGAIFAILCIAMLALLTKLTTPSFEFDTRFNVQDAYAQPDDSVEVLALGPSTMRRAFACDYLFDEYGISGYNCASNSQASIAAYYLLKDLLTTQGNSLKLVVLDVNPLTSESTMYERSIGAERVAKCMRPSLIRLEYQIALAREFSDIRLSEELFPLLRYHSRWNDLEDIDYQTSPVSTYHEYLHGQPVFTTMFQSNAQLNAAGEYTNDKAQGITDEVELDPEELSVLLNEQAVKWTDKIIQLCADEGIEVLLAKIPSSDWDDELHDAINTYAQVRGVPFLDLAQPDIWEETGLSYETDFSDQKHPNYLGSVKISEYLGNYLIDNYPTLNDVREQDNPPFTEEDVEVFYNLVQDADLSNCSSLSEYLDIINQKRYTAFIAVGGEAAEGLTDEIRDKLSAMGLEKLASLSKNESYVGVLEGGTCVLEKTKKRLKASADVGFIKGDLILKQPHPQTNAVTPGLVQLASIGNDEKARTEIIVGGVNKTEGRKGLTFVVYNNEDTLQLDTCTFDTHGDCSRK